MRTSRDLRWPATLVTACVLAALALACADAIRRSGWEFVPVLRHVAGVLSLQVLVGSVLGIGAWLLIGLERRISAGLARRRPRLGRWARPGFYALCAALGSASTAFWTFSGHKIQKSSLSLWAPYAFILLTGIGAALFVLWLGRIQLALARGQKLLPAVSIAVLSALSIAVIYVDLTVFVALYSRLHALLEVVAFTVIAALFALGLDLTTQRSARLKSGVIAVAGVGCAWIVLMVAVKPLRTWRDRALRHVWLEPAYAARALGRVQTVESFLRNPLAWRGVAESRMERLKQTYDISSTAQAPIWEQPLVYPRALEEKIRALRGTRRDYNVLVYYVDTLRQDVATDPTIMPHAVEFAKQSLEFRRAYAAGSDTLHSLPGITSGSYEDPAKSPGDLLQVAKAAKMERVLVIPQSAYEFLNKLKPTFEFDNAIQIWDYRPEKKDGVWGYGGDQPTSERLVDRTLEWLGQNREKRFFLWLFNFDQHNWRELDKDWVHGTAAKHEVPDEGLINWRYRVVATSIDVEFQRLLDGMHQLGLEKDTIVVFISDHGEGVGRDGFWVHAVFLWDCLLRVPLAIRVPGMAHRVVYDKVSLVDVAPTLARFLVDEPDTRRYQGEDLVSYLVPNRPPRRLPILASGVSSDNLVRVGLLDIERDWKLVLPLESGAPELYDLSVNDPDWLNVAEEHPAEVASLLSQLVRSPVFPRSAEDVDVKEREQRAAAAAAQNR